MDLRTLELQARNRGQLQASHGAVIVTAKRQGGIARRTWTPPTPKENATCYRASLDLSNKLAELRAGK